MYIIWRKKCLQVINPLYYAAHPADLHIQHSCRSSTERTSFGYSEMVYAFCRSETFAHLDLAPHKRVTSRLSLIKGQEGDVSHHTKEGDVSHHTKTRRCLASPPRPSPGRRRLTPHQSQGGDVSHHTKAEAMSHITSGQGQ